MRHAISTAREARANSQVTFSYGLLHTWAYQKKNLLQLCVDTRCRLDDLPWAMSKTDGERVKGIIAVSTTLMFSSMMMFSQQKSFYLIL